MAKQRDRQMTFDINRSSLTTQDAKTLISAFKLMKRRLGVEEIILVRPEMTIALAEALLVRACHAGVLETSGPFYDLTQDGLSLLHSGLRPRFDRARADAVIAKAIAAARKWNAKRSNLSVITELCLFGSTLRDQDSYGDVDIQIQTAIRPLAPAEMAKQVEALPYGVKRTLGGQCYPDLMVRERAAKSAQNAVNRSAREIALCLGHTIDSIGADHKQIYRYDLEQDAEVPAEMIHHPRSKPRVDMSSSGPTATSQVLPPIAAPIRPRGHSFWSSDLGSLADQYWRGKRGKKGSRHPYPLEDISYNAKDMGPMAWLETCSTWPLQSSDPFHALAELQSRGQEIGVMQDGELVFHIKDDTVSVEFPMKTSSAKQYALMVSAMVSRDKIDLNLLPHVVPAGQGNTALPSPLGNRLAPEHVSIARSAGQHLAAIYRMLSPAAAVKIKLSFAWSAGNDHETALPRLSALMNAMKSSRIEMHEKDLASAYASVEAELDSDRYAILSVSQSVEITMSCDAHIGDSDQEPCRLRMKLRDSLIAGGDTQQEQIPYTSFYQKEGQAARMTAVAEGLRAATSWFHLDLNRTANKYIWLEKDNPLPLRAIAAQMGVALRAADEAIPAEQHSLSA